uniref:Histone acetyltransferase n=1 Tax=Macrostomum lignano TaxID=282301 RepID=A0A1I8FK86_9PLAT
IASSSRAASSAKQQRLQSPQPALEIGGRFQCGCELADGQWYPGRDRAAKRGRRRSGPTRRSIFIHYLTLTGDLNEWVGIDRDRSGTLESAGLDPPGCQRRGQDPPDSGTKKRKFHEIHHVPKSVERDGRCHCRVGEEHQELTKVKYIDLIQIGKYEITTWYFSPYPDEYGKQTKLCDLRVLPEWTGTAVTLWAILARRSDSPDSNNLACILTLRAPHQRKGYGKLLISLSYELARSATSAQPRRSLAMDVQDTLHGLGLLQYWRGSYDLCLPQRTVQEHLLRILPRKAAAHRCRLPAVVAAVSKSPKAEKRVPTLASITAEVRPATPARSRCPPKSVHGHVHAWQADAPFLPCRQPAHDARLPGSAEGNCASCFRGMDAAGHEAGILA